MTSGGGLAFAGGVVIENMKLAFDINGGPDDLDIEFLRVNIVAHENALYDPQKSEFLEGHGTYHRALATGRANVV